MKQGEVAQFVRRRALWGLSWGQGHPRPFTLGYFWAHLHLGRGPSGTGGKNYHPMTPIPLRAMAYACTHTQVGNHETRTEQDTNTHTHTHTHTIARQTGTTQVPSVRILVSWNVKQDSACPTPIGAFLQYRGQDGYILDQGQQVDGASASVAAAEACGKQGWHSPPAQTALPSPGPPCSPFCFSVNEACGVTGNDKPAFLFVGGVFGGGGQGLA